MCRLLYVLFLAALLSLSPAHACLWDSDTLATEAKGLPDVVQVITGRFERNPPLFYEMRLARVSKEIQSQPAKLELYDDAAVACDRLHRSREAIVWMAKKRAQLKPFPQDKEHWYRYHANLGTFQAHDWLRSGANRKNISQMKSARDHIARAIKINPDAHFGREKYQLMAMEWIIKPPKNMTVIPDFLGLSSKIDGFPTSGPKTQREAIRGLCGLITLGAAWESVDVYHALEFALTLDRESSVAHLANLRIAELLRDGRHTLYPGATRDDEHSMVNSEFLNLPPQEDMGWKETDAAFMYLRREADEWQAKRTAYMVEHLKAGRHPDTDATFWTAWKDYGPPAIGEIPTQGNILRKQDNLSLTLMFVGLFGIVLLLWRIWAKKRKRLAAQTYEFH